MHSTYVFSNHLGFVVFYYLRAPISPESGAKKNKTKKQFHPPHHPLGTVNILYISI